MCADPTIAVAEYAFELVPTAEQARVVTGERKVDDVGAIAGADRLLGIPPVLSVSSPLRMLDASVTADMDTDVAMRSHWLDMRGIGIPERDREGNLLAEAVYDAVQDTFTSLGRAKRRDPDAVGEAIRRAVRAAVNERWGKKPMCYVHVLDV